MGGGAQMSHVDLRNGNVECLCRLFFTVLNVKFKFDICSFNPHVACE